MLLVEITGTFTNVVTLVRTNHDARSVSNLQPIRPNIKDIMLCIKSTHFRLKLAQYRDLII